MLWFFVWRLPFLLCLIGFLTLIVDGIKTFQAKNGNAPQQKSSMAEVIISFIRIIALSAIPIFNWLLAITIFIKYDLVREEMLEKIGMGGE